MNQAQQTVQLALTTGQLPSCFHKPLVEDDQGAEEIAAKPPSRDASSAIAMVFCRRIKKGGHAAKVPVGRAQKKYRDFLTVCQNCGHCVTPSPTATAS